MAKMTFLAIDGCLFSSLNNLIDAFHIANLWHRALEKSATGCLFETEIVSADGGPVHANRNVCIHPDGALSKACAADMIFIPAFIPTASGIVPFSSPKINTILSWLIAQHRSGTPIVSNCTGAFLLAETGLLDGRIATTNWQFARMFRRKYPKVNLKIDRIMTEADGLICTGAVTAVFDLAIHLIQRFGGETLASICAKAILVDPNRDSQTPYAIFQSNKGHGDKEILAAQSWMEANYAQAVSIDALAHRAGISPRHFKRRFRKATGTTPLVYLQNIRIQAAKEKLETTRESVNEITYCIGYEDSSTFRRLFKREIGLSPREYRDKFCRVPQAAARV